MSEQVFRQKAYAWQALLSDCVTSYQELLGLLELLPSQFQDFNLSDIDFPLRVPKHFVAKMKKGDSEDPLLRQVLPLADELHEVPGFTKDPLQEAKVNPVPGLLHKFHGRVLLTVAGACPINCRYCFRRHFSYQSNNPGLAGWSKALAYIAADDSINEVILSGGEPLLATDVILEQLFEGLTKIPHLKTLRIHTRMPLVIPERITQQFLTIFSHSNIRLVMVLHVNHAHEIDKKLKSAVCQLRAAGFSMLSQSVLLKGVNDSVEALQSLSEDLFSAGILPYYLHLLDKVSGAAHFDIKEEEAVALVHELRQHLPGYLLPRLVKEVAGEGSKVLLA